MDIFRRFPEEIRSVPPADIEPAKRSCSFNMQPAKLFVASSFGLFASLLRQRDFAPDGCARSPKFILVVDAVNRIALDDCQRKCSFGGKSFDSNQGSHVLQMQKLNSRIAELEAQIKDLEKTNEFLNSSAFVPFNGDIFSISF